LTLMADNIGPADVAIVGGGYSGTMLAAELARRNIRSILVERSGREGRGTAYSTPEDAHLLNVIAAKMGAWADQPEHFAKTVEDEGYQPDDFVPRRRYGEYLSAILREAQASGLVTVVQADAQTAKPREGGGWSIALGDGAKVDASALVVAHGNQSPVPPEAAESISDRLFVNDPWSDAGRAAIERAAACNSEVLLIGTGLTMIDVVLSLDEAGHLGRICALSRRGLAPRAHAEHDPAPVRIEEVPHGSLKQLWAWLRGRSALVGWRAAVDSIRPYTHQIWQALTHADRRRFLRHARPWWDVHRHRIAPEVAGRIRQLVQDGRLHIVAGRVKAMSEEMGVLRVAIQRRGMNDAKAVNFGLAVNCTGPLGSISESEDPLLNSLFDGGHARPDSLDLGLEVDGKSRIAGAKRAWALGPLTKGRFWEITAVPDIRGQVAQVAEDISSELK
jgi:uncharacterized NAD(P)/FAD-binding protein YdhS